ncbi:DUF3072 domain-containing protein [Microvirga aerilata]|jgi:hypothetical protein|uniref:DUF3072 domain-containing protein n=1 Tax=Microvirga aerilata TaxID=670292 RepID=A0A936Z6M8_9HYPH|nr:DUF3072 domain-containing protein [Microvirga aerilata]MBL0404373.1 DUF3072 domain-containing protein [Microvirga aerilata]
MTTNGKASTGSSKHHKDSAEASNPKTNPDPSDNQIKDPADWVTGDEPMTGAQASYLKTLSEQAHKPEAFDPDLDKAEASKRIDGLKQAKGH